MRKYTLILAALLCMLTTSSVSARSMEPVKGRAGFGYTESTGNTDESKMNFTLGLNQKRTPSLTMHYDALVLYGKSEGEKNEDKKTANIMAEFTKNDRFSWYAKAGYLEDEFSGYEHQYTLGLGLINYFTKSEDTVFSGTLGVEYTKEDYTDDTDNNETWLRVGFDGKRKLADNIKFNCHFGFLAPSEHTSDAYRTESSVGIVLTVNNKIDAELKYMIDYNKAPVDAKERYDRTFIMSLGYKI